MIVWREAKLFAMVFGFEDGKQVARIVRNMDGLYRVYYPSGGLMLPDGYAQEGGAMAAYEKVAR